MKKIRALSFLLVFSSLFLSGCFELVEEFKANKNGSGSYNLTLNASKSKSKLNNLFTKDSIGNTDIPTKQEVEELIHSRSHAFNTCEGVELAQYSCDLSNYIIQVKFEFESINQFNDAFYKVFGNRNVQFEITDNTMSRTITEKQISKIKRALGPFRFTDVGTGRFKTITKHKSPLKNSTCPITNPSQEGLSSYTDLSLMEFLGASQCSTLKLSK